MTHFETGFRVIIIFAICIGLTALLPLWGPVWLLGWTIHRFTDWSFE